MQRLLLGSLLAGCAANNIVSPATKLCMDIKLLCKDGSDKPGCKRKDASTLKRGEAPLHMWTCHDKANQNFEIIGGRVMNKAAGRNTSEHAELCIDIKAMCVDGSDTPGCKRQAVTNLTEDAEIQLWTCRKDDEAGRKSSSYGNQKWDLLGNGYWRNELTGLCLVAHHSEGDGTNGAKVHVEKCPEKDDAEFKFDFETGDMAAETNAAGTRLFSLGTVVETRAGSSAPLLAAAVAGALALAAAGLARRRSRGQAMVSELPLRAFE